MDELVKRAYRLMYPNHFERNYLPPLPCRPFFEPVTGYTLYDVAITPRYSEVAPHEVDLSTQIGPITLPLPILGAAMDTVSGPVMARKLSDLGGCAIIWRAKRAQDQIEMVKQALDYKHCLVANPVTLSQDQTLEDAHDLLRRHGFSTIPVVSKQGQLKGVLFTNDISFKNREEESVESWMVPLKKLKTEKPDTPFEKIRSRLLNEKNCTVLPIVDEKEKFHGIYFMKDFRLATPSTYNGNPLVGMAVGASEADLNRVREGLKLGVGIFVLDSSHGNSKAVIEQAKKIVNLVKGNGAVIAGNVADIDGYFRLAQTGVDGVKFGIGSGSICTTTTVTGAAYPMFTLLRQARFLAHLMREKGLQTPAIIADGGVGGPGPAAKALAAGAHAVMAGEWLVAAKESQSFQIRGQSNGKIYYRGMASKAAIHDRVSDRYGNQKTAEEGVEGLVDFRGPLQSWIGDDLELLRGGFAHAGGKDIASLHERCDHPMAFVVFTGVGQQQNATRIEKL